MKITRRERLAARLAANRAAPGKRIAARMRANGYRVATRLIDGRTIVLARYTLARS